MSDFEKDKVKITFSQRRTRSATPDARYDANVDKQTLGGPKVTLTNKYSGNELRLTFPGFFSDAVKFEADVMRFENLGYGSLERCVRFSHSPAKDGAPTTSVTIDAGRKFGLLGTPVWELVGKHYLDRLPETIRACATSTESLDKMLRLPSTNRIEGCYEVSGKFDSSLHLRAQHYVVSGTVPLDELQLESARPVPCNSTKPTKRSAPQ